MAEPYAIECPTCGVPSGAPCRATGQPTGLNHMARGIALAVARSPYEPVIARAN